MVYSILSPIVTEPLPSASVLNSTCLVPVILGSAATMTIGVTVPSGSKKYIHTSIPFMLPYEPPHLFHALEPVLTPIVALRGLFTYCDRPFGSKSIGVLFLVLYGVPSVFTLLLL